MQSDAGSSSKPTTDSFRVKGWSECWKQEAECNAHVRPLWKQGQFACGLKDRKIRVEKKCSSAPDDSVSDNGLLSWPTPHYAWATPPHPEQQQGLANKEVFCNRCSVDFKEWMEEWVNEQTNRMSFSSRLAMFLLFFRERLSPYSSVNCFLTYWK